MARLPIAKEGRGDASSLIDSRVELQRGVYGGIAVLCARRSRELKVER